MHCTAYNIIDRADETAFLVRTHDLKLYRYLLISLEELTFNF